MEFDDVRVGGQFRVGSAGICPPIKEGDKKINGSMHAEGPVVFGDPGQEKEQRATLIVNRTDNDDEDSLKPKKVKRSVWINGNMFLSGDDGTPYALNQVGNTIINGNKQTPYTLNIQSKAGDAININNGTVWIDDSGEAMFKTGTGGQTLSDRFSSADDRPKPFDIKHPSREGYRLRYACVEGPEVGVYCRGRVKNEKVIILPSYWKDFVYIDSISVQLQPIGAHQDVIIKRWDDEKIYLQSRGGMPIDCFYHVYAERNDINPLITEYQGESHRDYPDPNHHIIPDNERNYKDPEYATEQNIRTK
tara:strand:+ start:1100 stop:2014 length:915 start_codon:yes stop_codon:yes gene_type:complete